MLLLLPCDPLRGNRPDEHFATEALAARDVGVRVALVDHDELGRPGGSDLAVARVPPDPDAVYRGWMLGAERYEAFSLALARRGTALRTSGAQYRRGHELPGWYDLLAPWTFESVWTEGAGRDAFDAARRSLGGGPAVLRDHTKSEKHHWDDAAFVPDLADADAAWQVARRLRELRDEAFTGGFVLRRFERLTGPEVRTWWVEGRCALVGAHPDTADAVPDDDAADGLPAGLGDAVAASGLPFVTVDLVRHEDGRWRVVEMGDGQVSDRPSTLAAHDLLQALLEARPVVR